MPLINCHAGRLEPGRIGSMDRGKNTDIRMFNKIAAPMTSSVVEVLSA